MQVCLQSDMGWALKKERKRARFSDDLKSYLSDIFLQRESVGAKVHSSAKNEYGEKYLVQTNIWLLVKSHLLFQDFLY